MTLVTAQQSVSLDGCYAGPRDEDGGDWLAGREAAGCFRVTRWVGDAMAWRERQCLAGGDDDTNSRIIAAARRGRRSGSGSGPGPCRRRSGVPRRPG